MHEYKLNGNKCKINSKYRQTVMGLECYNMLINPRHACAGGLRYLLCVSVCLSVTTLAAVLFIFTIKLRYEGLQLSILFIFNFWIF